MRIAMWSGPRNISTAMMYAFANRADCAAWDEPFYAPYLAETGLAHPMAAEILAQHETNPDIVAQRCLGPIPGDKAHFYMKHMPLHMLPQFPLDWADSCVNVHLIRHPARVVASYSAKRENPTLADIGFAQQVAFFQRFPGPVLDSADIRENPGGMIQALCAEIGLAFDPNMLVWPAGRRSFDGIWAAHWYHQVHKSTGFAGAEGPMPALEGESAALAQAALPYYHALAAQKLQC